MNEPTKTLPESVPALSSGLDHCRAQLVLRVDAAAQDNQVPLPLAHMVFEVERNRLDTIHQRNTGRGSCMRLIAYRRASKSREVWKLNRRDNYAPVVCYIIPKAPD